MKTYAEMIAEEEAKAAGGKAGPSEFKSYADMIAEEEAKAKPTAAPDTSGNVPALFNVKDAIAENLANPVPAKRALPGDTPRLAAPDDPARPQIAMDSAIASAENAETPEHAAERHYNAALAGSQDMVPFFPRIRATVAGGIAGLQGKPMGPAYDAEFAHAQKQIAEAKAGSPVYAAMGAAPVALAMPGGVAAKTMGGRVLGGAAMGGLYGADAVDRPGVTKSELAQGFAAGAGVGAVGTLLAEGIRAGARSANAREDKAFMREITHTEGGEGTLGILAKNKEGLVRDYKKVIELRRDPEIRAAVKMSGGEGVPIIDAKIKPFAEAQGPRYDAIDAAVVTSPGKMKAMTGQKLLDQLEDAKGDLSAEAAAKIGNIQTTLREHWLGRVWKKGEYDIIPSQDLRNWLSSVQTSAANTPGALNWTNNFQSTTDASRAAKRIFNDYLDGARLPDVVEAIRRDNVPISVLNTVKSAIEAKAKKEQLQIMGLGQVTEKQTRGLTRAGAAAAAVHGNLPAAAALLAEPYAEKGAIHGLRWINGLMDRMNMAADAGATKVQLFRWAIENGMPKGLANVAADKFAKKMVEPPAPEKKAPGKYDFMVPMVMGEGK